MARQLASVKIDLLAHPGHGVIMALTLRINNTMHFNKVPAKAGYLWFEQGLQLFWKNLAIFLIGSLCYSLFDDAALSYADAAEPYIAAASISADLNLLYDSLPQYTQARAHGTCRVIQQLTPHL